MADADPPVVLFRLAIYSEEFTWAAVRIGREGAYTYQACQIPRGLASWAEYRPLLDYVLEKGTPSSDPPEYP